MLLLIDVDAEAYLRLKLTNDNADDIGKWVRGFQIVPDDCEILTKEAYEDLCLRASMDRED